MLFSLEHTMCTVPHMKEKGGSIFDTSSVSAVCAGYAPITYSVAKKGGALFSKLAAAELAKYKNRVNSILLGFIATSIIGASIGNCCEIRQSLNSPQESS